MCDEGLEFNHSLNICEEGTNHEDLEHRMKSLKTDEIRREGWGEVAAEYECFQNLTQDERKLQ